MIIRISNPKGYERGAMPREVGMDTKGAGFVHDYLRVRGDTQGPLFLTDSGEAVIPSYIRDLLPRLATIAGINRRVHPHCFRHTFAIEMYKEGVGLLEIMGALGHTSLLTTQKYLRDLGAERVINVTMNRSW